MRQCGYAPEQETNRGELVFSRIIGPSRTGYPKFHLYIQPGETKSSFNLHLDQKAPIYRRTAAHGGEYDGAIIDNETERIKNVYKTLKLSINSKP